MKGQYFQDTMPRTCTALKRNRWLCYKQESVEGQGESDIVVLGETADLGKGETAVVFFGIQGPLSYLFLPSVVTHIWPTR